VPGRSTKGCSCPKAVHRKERVKAASKTTLPIFRPFGMTTKQRKKDPDAKTDLEVGSPKKRTRNRKMKEDTNFIGRVLL